MPKALQPEKPQEMEPRQSETFNELIRDQVIHALGKPADLFKVQVKLVWDNHYRVNVLVGADAGSVSVAQSYFLVVDGAGKLVNSTPAITRRF